MKTVFLVFFYLMVPMLCIGQTDLCADLSFALGQKKAFVEKTVEDLYVTHNDPSRLCVDMCQTGLDPNAPYRLCSTCPYACFFFKNSICTSIVVDYVVKSQKEIIDHVTDVFNAKLVFMKDQDINDGSLWFLREALGRRVLYLLKPSDDVLKPAGYLGYKLEIGLNQ